ncbi:hypothetical protein Tco_1551837 [Tanacetum coccineum]
MVKTGLKLLPPLPQISSPPLPVSSPVSVLSPSPPASPIHPPEVTLPPRKRLGIAFGPGYEVRESSSAAAARPARGLRADYGFVATIDREIKRDLERDVGYGITEFWDEIVEAIQGTPVVTDVAKFSQRITEFETRVRQDTDEIYTRLDDEQSERQTVITEMLAADHRRQEQLTKALKLVKRLQTQIAELQRQHGPVNGSAQPDALEEADSSS